MLGELSRACGHRAIEGAVWCVHGHVELVGDLFAILLDFGSAVLEPVLVGGLAWCSCCCCCHCTRPRGTHVDLVQRHAQSRGKVLLDKRAGLVLHLKVLLEDIVLLLGQARLHIAGGRFLGWWWWVRMRGPACFLRRAGWVHGRQQAANSDTLSSRLVSHDRQRREQRSEGNDGAGGCCQFEQDVQKRSHCCPRQMMRRARGLGVAAASERAMDGGCCTGTTTIIRTSRC
jgi:hypothetical protein